MQLSMFMMAASSMVLGKEFQLVKRRGLKKFQTKNICWQVPAVFPSDGELETFFPPACPGFSIIYSSVLARCQWPGRGRPCLHLGFCWGTKVTSHRWSEKWARCGGMLQPLLALDSSPLAPPACWPLQPNSLPPAPSLPCSLWEPERRPVNLSPLHLALLFCWDG